LAERSLKYFVTFNFSMYLYYMEREIKVIDLYLSGVSASKISKDLGINRRSIYRILHRNNIRLQKNSKSKVHMCVLCGNECSTRRRRCDACNIKIRRYLAKKKRC